MCYKQADMDNNGRIDFKEFCGICDQISLSDELLGGGGRATLWGYADREGRGTIDFQEFLAAVIGSLSI
jgi:Ca2+-binding EF-hand superfamily protein